jgi:hypothetical protein
MDGWMASGAKHSHTHQNTPLPPHPAPQHTHPPQTQTPKTPTPLTTPHPSPSPTHTPGAQQRRHGRPRRALTNLPGLSPVAHLAGHLPSRRHRLLLRHPLPHRVVHPPLAAGVLFGGGGGLADWLTVCMCMLVGLVIETAGDGWVDGQPKPKHRIRLFSHAHPSPPPPDITAHMKHTGRSRRREDGCHLAQAPALPLLLSHGEQGIDSDSGRFGSAGRGLGVVVCVVVDFSYGGSVSVYTTSPRLRPCCATFPPPPILLIYHRSIKPNHHRTTPSIPLLNQPQTPPDRPPTNQSINHRWWPTSTSPASSSRSWRRPSHTTFSGCSNSSTRGPRWRFTP